MATNDHLRRTPFDVFISYEQKIETTIGDFYQALTSGYDLNIYVDSRRILLASKKKFYEKTSKAIMKSKMMICCINKDFLNSRKCKNELLLAYMTMKPILVIFMQQLNRNEYEPLMFALEEATRYQLADKDWNDRLVMYLVTLIQSSLKRKIGTRNNLRRNISYTELLKSIDGADDADDEDDEKPNDESHICESPVIRDSVLSVATYIEPHADKTVITDPKYNNLCHLKQNQIFEFAFGYNRMAYLTSQQRYVITSSYNKTMVTVGSVGNWIERRNPHGLLKQPYSICVNRFNEIYVGDNQLKCIFIFDSHYKHLRTFADGLLPGFSDMVIDSNNNDLYTISMYDSLLSIVDIREDEIVDKTFISAPTYIRVHDKKIYVTTTEDIIYVLCKATLSVDMRIEFCNCKLMSGLFVYNDHLIFTTVHKVYKCYEKTKDKYLAIVRLTSDETNIQFMNMNIEQVNDMYMLNDHMVCISDTDVNVFSYKNITNF